MTGDSLFWADKYARQVIERVESEPVLQKIAKKKGYICLDEKTPSGHIHIGSGRGWIIHDLVAKALRDLGVKGRFILSADDIDPMDKPPAGLDSKKYEQYMGVPFYKIPSPEPGYKTYSDYYFRECTDKFEEFGIEAELESTGNWYERGDFNPTIKIALDNHEKIRSIYERIYKKTVASDKLPFNPICENCGKIGTTVAYEWNSDTEMLKYRCSPDLVKWAQGCGHDGEISPYDGNGKLPWKVEWAAKWPTVGVLFETAGKDHFTVGGSRTVAIAICDEVFDHTPPIPSSRKEIGSAYEFFNIGGKKMSTSKGEGVGFAEIAEKIPPKLLRYLLVRTRPHAALDFDPFGTNKLLLLAESYDRCERIYYGEEKADNEREEAHEKRVYELSNPGGVSTQILPQIPFGYASMVVQACNFDIDSAIAKLRQSEYIPEKLSKEGLDHLKERLEMAASWVSHYAPDEYKFTLLDKLKKGLKIESSEKNAILKIVSKIDSSSEKELEALIYETAKELGSPGNFFRTFYIVLLGKEKGPRLASFLKTLAQERVEKLTKYL